VIENAIPTTEPPMDLATRIAGRTMAARGPDYATEVRRLLDAGLEVMRACGTSSRPRVADIVTAAGLSNEAFYRHFASKDLLVAALFEDGAERLTSYLAHQMAKEPTPEGQLRRWVEGILSQADDDEVAATTLAVMWNAGSVGAELESGPPSTTAPLAALVRDPLERLGSRRPDLDATLVAHAVVGRLTDHLWSRTRPPSDDTDHLVAFCLAACMSAAR
jgi:AcrR family transcriptional regulator